MIEYLPVIAPGLARDAFMDRLQSAIESGCDRLNADALVRNPELAMTPAAARG